jgi:hypothetical protein
VPEAGWYPDPSGSPGLRWWDGERWSDETHPLPDPDGSPLATSGGEPGTQTQTLATPAVAPPATEAARGRGRAIALVAGLLVVILLAVTALSYGLSRPRITTKLVEQQIAQSIADQVGSPAVVTCPDSVDAGAGIAFTCDVSVEGGKTATVKVTQTDDQGTVTWDVVAAP